MFQKKSTDMLEGSPLWSMVFFAMPMIIGNLFQQFYNMADSAIVGKFVSENALAAVGASYSLTNVFICIAIGGGVGSSVLTSQYLGSRDYGSMKTSVYTALTSFFRCVLFLRFSECEPVRPLWCGSGHRPIFLPRRYCI